MERCNSIRKRVYNQDNFGGLIKFTAGLVGNYIDPKSTGVDFNYDTFLN